MLRYALMGRPPSEKARDGEPNPSAGTRASDLATAVDLFGLPIGHGEAAALVALFASRKEDMLAIRELPLNELDLPAFDWPEMLP